MQLENIQEIYNKNLEEFKQLSEEHNNLDAQIREAQERLKNLYIAAMAARKVVTELQPFVKTEAPTPTEEPVVEDTKEEQKKKK